MNKDYLTHHRRPDAEDKNCLDIEEIGARSPEVEPYRDDLARYIVAIFQKCAIFAQF